MPSHCGEHETAPVRSKLLTSFEMAFLSFKDVLYRRGALTVLNRVSFDLEAGETLVLLGRSGSGKTTALRLINRLLEPESGTILFDGEDIQHVDPILLRRKIGYVIQEIGLLPHWTVGQNIALVPTIAGWEPGKRDERARELLSQVGLPPDEYLRRYPRALSGGQRQRVGVARALAASPALLLFDEPFGALDPVTRREMQLQFLALRDRYQTPSVFVTHDVAEALTLASRIAVLDAGNLETIATPDDFRNVSTPVARSFLDTLTPLDKVH